MCGIAIVKPYPFHARHLGNAVDELSYHLLAVEVCSVARQFLRNYLKLLNAFRHQTLHFSHDFFDGMGLLFPSDDRNGTISTMPIAAFAYLQIGIVRRCRKVPLIGGFLMIGSIQVCDDLLPIELAVELIYFGQFLLKFLEVALREATHHD